MAPSVRKREVLSTRDHDDGAYLNIGSPDERVVHELPWSRPERASGAPPGSGRLNPWGQFTPPSRAWRPAPWLRTLAGVLFGYGSGGRPRPCRVVLSHTSELRRHPQGRSFVAAAEAAVCRAGHAIVDMEYLSAADADPADRCASMVASGHVYVGIIGFRYGGLVPGRVEQSFTELEYETAKFLGMTRLVFIIEDNAELPPADQPEEHSRLQEAFRNRLREVSFVSIATPSELEIALYQALVEWEPPRRLRSARRQLL